MNATWIWHGAVEVTGQADEVLCARADKYADLILDIWEEASDEQAMLFDGVCAHVCGVQKGIVGVMLIPYRWWVAQVHGVDLGIRSLGVTGWVTSADGLVLLGRRHADVTQYAERWEAVPAGTVDTMELAHVICSELDEEVGIETDPDDWTCSGIIYDESEHIYDVVWSTTLPQPAATYELYVMPEYDCVQWMSPQEVLELPFATTVPTLEALAKQFSPS